MELSKRPARKPHGRDCSCRDCMAVEQLNEQAKRLDAYKSAQALLKEVPTPEDNPHTPHEHLLLANWLFYGGGDDDDG